MVASQKDLTYKYVRSGWFSQSLAEITVIPIEYYEMVAFCL